MTTTPIDINENQLTNNWDKFVKGNGRTDGKYHVEFKIFPGQVEKFCKQE
jgi:hypothetical protein